MIHTYQILELGLTLESEDAAFLADLDADFLRFRTMGPPAGRPLLVRFEAGAKPSLTVNGVRQSLEGHPQPAQAAYFAVQRLIMDGQEGFTVLHAAVLEAQGGAVAICGSPGTGKTTLTLDLLEAGLGFLSDDYCPVHRASGLVHPFPRSLWVREPRTDPATRGHQLHRGKRQLSPDPQAFRVVTTPLPLKAFLFLHPGRETPGPLRLEVRIQPEARDAFLIAAQAILGVHAQPGQEPHAVQVDYPRQGSAIRQLAELLETHREALWNFFGLPTSDPDFTQVPRLEPLATHEAAFLLLKERKQTILYQGGQRMAPGAFLAHLNEILVGARCHLLTPGPRGSRLDLVLSALARE